MSPSTPGCTSTGSSGTLPCPANPMPALLARFAFGKAGGTATLSTQGPELFWVFAYPDAALCLPGGLACNALPGGMAVRGGNGGAIITTPVPFCVPTPDKVIDNYYPDCSNMQQSFAAGDGAHAWYFLLNSFCTFTPAPTPINPASAGVGYLYQLTVQQADGSQLSFEELGLPAVYGLLCAAALAALAALTCAPRPPPYPSAAALPRLARWLPPLLGLHAASALSSLVGWLCISSTGAASPGEGFVGAGAVLRLLAQFAAWRCLAEAAREGGGLGQPAELEVGAWCLTALLKDDATNAAVLCLLLYIGAAVGTPLGGGSGGAGGGLGCTGGGALGGPLRVGAGGAVAAVVLLALARLWWALRDAQRQCERGGGAAAVGASASGKLLVRAGACLACLSASLTAGLAIGECVCVCVCVPSSLFMCVCVFTPPLTPTQPRHPRRRLRGAAAGGPPRRRNNRRSALRGGPGRPAVAAVAVEGRRGARRGGASSPPAGVAVVARARFDGGQGTAAEVRDAASMAAWQRCHVSQRSCWTLCGFCLCVCFKLGKYCNVLCAFVVF